MRRSTSKAVDAGEHYIQHDQQISATGGPLQAAFAIVRSFYDKAFRLQVFADQSAEFNVIVDNQNAFHISGFHCAPCNWRFAVKNCQNVPRF